MRWNITVRFNKKSDWSKKIFERANVGKGLENIKFINLLLCLVLNALQQRLLFWIFILCFVRGLSDHGVTPKGRVLIEMRVAGKQNVECLNFLNNFEVMLMRLYCLCLLRCLTSCNEPEVQARVTSGHNNHYRHNPSTSPSLTESRRWVLRKMMLFEIDYHKFKQPSNVHPITSSR